MSEYREALQNLTEQADNVSDVFRRHLGVSVTQLDSAIEAAKSLLSRPESVEPAYTALLAQGEPKARDAIADGFHKLLDAYFNALVREPKGHRQTQIDKARLAIIAAYESVEPAAQYDYARNLTPSEVQGFTKALKSRVVEPAAAEKARELFKHKKTGNLYEVHGVVVDCTNSRDGTGVILYGRVGEPPKYVRDAADFSAKFEPLPSPPAATGETK